MNRLRYILLGDGESPHLLKWARALAPLVDVYVCSSRGLMPELAALVPLDKCLLLNTSPQHGGGNSALLRQLPKVTRWLKQVDADWINPHYLTSHGTLAVLARRHGRLRARLIASAWGSDVLVTPKRHIAYRWLTQSILRNATLCTSDSQHMTAEMYKLGAKRVETFPFGLDKLPPVNNKFKQPWLVYSNRGLEPIYQPLRMLEIFRSLHSWQPEARLVVANSGSMLAEMQAWVARENMQDLVQFVGRLSSEEQAHWYQRAQWYVSVPQSDSVAVSVLEAMAYGCIPLLSDLPANHELVQDGHNGWIIPAQLGSADLAQATQQVLPPLLNKAKDISHSNHLWVQQNGMFQPHVQRLLATLQTLP